MSSVDLDLLVARCEQLLKPNLFIDYDRAHNGLQVGNRGRIHRIAAAVDASMTTVRMAVEAEANLLLVHHGLFWGASVPWTGRRLELLRLLLESDMAVYSMHLPLDAHRTLGNSACLAKALGLRGLKPFFMHKGRAVGWKSSTRISREELGGRLRTVLDGPVVLLPGGGEECRHIGICTGGAGSELLQAAQEGVDTFITGEGPHWTHALAEDAGLNVFYGGHYATETFGVRALAESLSCTFEVPWTFLDHPSGL